MEAKNGQVFPEAAALQKLWTDSIMQMVQIWGQFSPGQPPPDAMREMRNDLLKVLTDTWDQFMRTPQFMECMKTSLESFMQLRQFTADALTRQHHELQVPAREDIDAVLLAIRHLERRLLDRFEEIEQGVGALTARIEQFDSSRAGPAEVTPHGTSTGEKPAPSSPPRKTSRRSHR